MFIAIMVWACAPKAGDPPGTSQLHIKLSESHYSNLNFAAIRPANICVATLFKELDPSHVIVAGTYRIDSTFDYIDLDSVSSIFILEFDSDSVRDYRFCSDIWNIEGEAGSIYQFSSGAVHRTLAEVDSANLRIIFEVDSAYFRNGPDSVLVNDVILWNDMPKNNALHRSFILGNLLSYFSVDNN
jgi:hypothetical protein